MHLNNGVILLYKPIGITSAKAVSIVKRAAGFKKIGHCGTLDPMAEGLLITSYNKATKIASLLMKQKKHYIAVVKFGIATETDDREGKIVARGNISVTKENLESLLPKYTGWIEQMPPVYSALKIKGKPAYKLAREGKEVNLNKRKVFVEKIQIIDFCRDMAVLSIHCSHGTYIRSIARDIGMELGSYACLERLVRVGIGDFTIFDSDIIFIEQDNEENKDLFFLNLEKEISEKSVSVKQALNFLPVIEIDEDYRDYPNFGRKLSCRHFKEDINNKDNLCLVVDSDGRELALIDEELKYKGIFV